MMLLQRLRLRTTAVIFVQLGRPRVIFETRGASLAVEPFLYLAVEEPRGRVVSIGEACPNRAAHRVALFADEPLPFASISRRELAEAFFSYAYMKIRPRFAILAPIVVLLPTGDERFTSECAQHLVQAAAAAGASEVYWNGAFAEQYG